MKALSFIEQSKKDVISMNKVMDLYNLPFDYGRLMNREWKPEGKHEFHEVWMPDNTKKRMIDVYNDAEAKVLFKNVRIDYESCDCGDGYGCSHASYPIGIGFSEDESFFLEEDSYYADNKVSFHSPLPKTIGEFVEDCSRCGFNLEWSDEVVEKYFKI